MKKMFPVMYDIPDRTLSIAGLIIGVFFFYTFPFLALFFSGGTTDSSFKSWFDCIYHGVNFCITLWLFRHYLKDSFFNVHTNLKPFLKTVFSCAGFMITYCIIFLEVAFPNGSDNMLFAATGTLPLVEMEIHHLSSNLVAVNPIGGLISVLIFAPVTISCIYYASAFAPFCANRPWLAYPVMAIVLAVPRALSSLTFWRWDENLLLYLAQLPLHWIACYAYQKTDTVWAPIILHAVANAASCLLYLFLF